MRILFDTHALIWFLENSTRIPSRIKSILLDSGAELFFSPVSILEIAIKHSLKPELMPCAPDEVRDTALASSISELPFGSLHARIVGDLPWHHRDPFDRMLVAQAQVEGMRLLSHDDLVCRYGDFVLAF